MTQKTANHHPDLPHPCNLLQLHSLLEKVERPRQPQHPLEAGWLGEGELLLVVGQWVSSWVGAVVVYVQIYEGVAVVEPVRKCLSLLHVGTVLHGTNTRTCKVA